jgi:hypothetical protein
MALNWSNQIPPRSIKRCMHASTIAIKPMVPTTREVPRDLCPGTGGAAHPSCRAKRDACVPVSIPPARGRLGGQQRRAGNNARPALAAWCLLLPPIVLLRYASLRRIYRWPVAADSIPTGYGDDHQCVGGQRR